METVSLKRYVFLLYYVKPPNYIKFSTDVGLIPVIGEGLNPVVVKVSNVDVMHGSMAVTLNCEKTVGTGFEG